MKFFIVGKQSSGKLEALNELSNQGIVVGHEFSNVPELYPQLYMDPQYEQYDIDDIDKIFENDSYICIGGIEEKNIVDSYTFYRGISFYTLDNADVVILTPSQVCNINKKAIKDHIVFVWLDGTKDHRIHRHASENRSYDFNEIESYECKYDNEFVKILYGFPNSDVLYFNNEDPCRVATIIAAIVKHPELLESFVNNFN